MNGRARVYGTQQPAGGWGSGCSRHSPSVLINFTPSSMHIMDNLGKHAKDPNSGMQAAPSAQRLCFTSNKDLVVPAQPFG